MAWPVPKYSRNQVNRAGNILIADSPTDDELQRASDVLSNWRSCHGYPINTFQSTLRDKLRKPDKNAIIAQRLKRTPSIISKLKRYQNMKLARMQDIGGLRAVVKDVNALVNNYKNSRFEHTLIKIDNYIENPKKSGYRSVHLIYKYQNKLAPEYNGLLLELQIRSRLQHTWATAVETMGTFLNHALKSSEGPDDWLNFFSLTGSAFAHLERSPPVPEYKHLSPEETYTRVSKVAKSLNVRTRLTAFGVAANQINTDKQSSYYYHLIVLNPEEKSVSIQSFARGRLEEANNAYTLAERRIEKGEPLQVVLVSAGPLEALRRAYPNYFLDTNQFIQQLNRIERTL